MSPAIDRGTDRGGLLRRYEAARRSREIKAWIGLLVPPLAWLAALSLCYALVPWACRGGPVAVLHGVTLLALAAAVLGGSCAWLAWADAGVGGPGARDESTSRQRFVALVGLLSSGVFVAVLLAQEIANVVLEPCLA